MNWKDENQPTPRSNNSTKREEILFSKLNCNKAMVFIDRALFPLSRLLNYVLFFLKSSAFEFIVATI